MENIMLPSSAKILDIIHETTAEYTFRVAYDQPIRHGQFFQLSIPKVGEAPISVSAKGDGWIEFTIRKVGRLTEGLFGLQPGHTIFLRGPYGNYFPLESFDNKALVVIAGGTGWPRSGVCSDTMPTTSRHPGCLSIAGFKDINSVLSPDLQRFGKPSIPLPRWII